MQFLWHQDQDMNTPRLHNQPNNMGSWKVRTKGKGTRGKEERNAQSVRWRGFRVQTWVHYGFCVELLTYWEWWELKEHGQFTFRPSALALFPNSAFSSLYPIQILTLCKCLTSPTKPPRIITHSKVCPSSLAVVPLRLPWDQPLFGSCYFTTRLGNIIFFPLNKYMSSYLGKR